MNYSLNVKSSSIVHTLLSNCVKLLGKVQKLLIQCINYSVISKQIRVVSPKFYTVRKNFTGPPVPPVPTNLKSALGQLEIKILLLSGKCFNIPHWSRSLSPMRESKTLKSGHGLVKTTYSLDNCWCPQKTLEIITFEVRV